MKAVILVGGYGTRLRPLTLTRLKPLVEFCNEPLILHQIRSLVAAGVNHVILAVASKKDMMNKFVEEQEKNLNITITLSIESSPMGTAGPLALARDQLLGKKTQQNGYHNNNNEDGDNSATDDPIEDDGEPFFVLNSDIVCAYPFEEMKKFHKHHGGEGTIAVTRVEDASKFGVVVYDDNGLVEKFVEKPKEFVSNKINAGLYIFNKSILNRIPLKTTPTSIEKETFPAMASDKKLFAMPYDGYWSDVGQPADYLKGVNLHLNWLQTMDKRQLVEANGQSIIGNVLIHKSAKIGKDCQIGPDVCIGPNVVIEDGVKIMNSTILNGSKIGKHSYLDGSIIGWDSLIHEYVHLEEGCVLGEGVELESGVCLNGTTVLHNKVISKSIHDRKSVVL